MIPILYERNEMQFSSNGLGRLTDIISCHVSEERNGVYECEFTVPINGKNFKEIKEGRKIGVTHDETGDIQPFIISKRNASLNGKVTFKAFHLSYELSRIVAMPYRASGIVEALADIVPNSANPNPFEFWTDKVATAEFRNEIPRPVRSMLGGERGSILDVYGKGEYEFDKWKVNLHLNRGHDSGVTIRYGKNLSELTQSLDASGVYNAVVPYWKSEESVMTLPEGIIALEGVTDIRAAALDLSSSFENQPTEEELRNMARTRLENASGINVSENIKVDFVQLWQTEEYKEYAPLQRVHLCDTVTVIYGPLGINVKKKVIMTKWDVLHERYSEIELGDSRTTLADVISDITTQITGDMPTASMMAQAISNATNRITGNKGGYVVLHNNADGVPYEFLVMDSPNINTAVNVWRWNMGGLGFSSTGYNGNYSSLALTMDGQINADLITVGTMTANRIKGGVLQLGGNDNGNGVMELRTADGTLVGRMDNGGLRMFGATGYVSMNFEEGFAGFDLNGNKLYWVAYDQFHMKKAVVEDEITLCGDIRFIEISNEENTGVGVVAVGV